MEEEVLVVSPKAVGRRIRLLRVHGLGMSGAQFAEEILGVKDTGLAARRGEQAAELRPG